MDRFDVINFADLSGPNGGDWVRIGGGSFGVVFKGEYLGTEVAIKEVLPNNTYDVEKYFERECVLMKEARHPNIVQYIGLTKSPGLDGRIYIISEFVGSNVRSYLADHNKPFPWRLRMSFAMDISRALAYLHARNCMHRDLKGENLLITANERIKVCDFGFARIAARNEDEMRRISYCGTDGYMSPEILLGVDFGLPSDVFSLGVIFAEIASRHLVDSYTFKRVMPTFGLDADEVREMASEGCPDSFIQLALDCVEEDPRYRPDMRQVVSRLAEIEREVLMREEAENRYAIGSVRGATIQSIMGTKLKRAAAPRLPSFNGALKLNGTTSRAGSDDSGDEIEEALAALEKIGVEPDHAAAPGAIKGSSTLKVAGHGNPWWSDDAAEALPSINRSWLASPGAAADRMRQESEAGLLDNADYAESDYSTSVVRSSKMTARHAPLAMLDERPSTLSIRTLRQGDSPLLIPARRGSADLSAIRRGSESAAMLSPTRRGSNDASTLLAAARRGSADPAMALAAARRGSTEASMQSYMTARTHRPDTSMALATIASVNSGQIEPVPIHHRFTLVKNGTRRPNNVVAAAQAMASGSAHQHQHVSSYPSLVPPAVMLSNALAKCWVCGKRMGWKPFMDCDDCPYKTHVACAELAPPTCQDLAIPLSGAAGGSHVQPVLSPHNASRRNSKATDVGDQREISAAAAALRRASLADSIDEPGSPQMGKPKTKKKLFGGAAINKSAVRA
ncbi:Protein kinase C-like, phorbol ester/diacylglycerol binding [Kalmanozyma brasiliensis GHG001]|uniref:Protein kinase n=1 Tax=Kalmanozyma brasiliensis (strain GHG001) TaxID=1365824 RepID=V5F0E5_KALBG|nr:Protein kinase C-like, phorbol ester/diacylglycerol binding [Kalmanozyma brasiliensis GHG001]EST08674.1 Protein kinase C-like, phorbol ester/diacylglycerol binding [Kalmanozyma brasiliensis GHG001]